MWVSNTVSGTFFFPKRVQETPSGQVKFEIPKCRIFEHAMIFEEISFFNATFLWLLIK